MLRPRCEETDVNSVLLFRGWGQGLVGGTSCAHDSLFIVELYWSRSTITIYLLVVVILFKPATLQHTR